MFSISTTTEQEVELLVLTDNSSHTQVAIAPACGAAVYSFVVDTGEAMLN